MTYTWTHISPLPGGHTLYTRDDGDIAIGDRSGDIPERTDDGVLWLDLSAERIPGYSEISRSVSIPVTDDKTKNPLSVNVTLVDYLLIADYWGNQINVRGVVFTMMRTNDHNKLLEEAAEGI